MAWPRNNLPQANASRLSNPRTEIYAADISSLRIANACRAAPVRNRSDISREGHMRVSPADDFMQTPPIVKQRAAKLNRRIATRGAPQKSKQCHRRRWHPAIRAVRTPRFLDCTE